MDSKFITTSKSLLIAACFLFVAQSAGASEVYYLGSGSSGQSGLINENYSLVQRFKDLAFSLRSAQKDRSSSGYFGGSMSQSMMWNNVGGNKTKSYLEKGVDYLSEYNLSLREKLYSDYVLEGQWFLRKTDDRRIENRKDLRMKQFDVRVSNEQNLFQFGNFYADFSQFVLGTSLEGFNVDVNPAKNQHYQAVVARKGRADITTDIFQRDVFGIKADHYFFQNSEKVSNCRVGLQMASSQDDSSTLPDPSGAVDLRNIVSGVDGEFSLVQGPALQYEYAHSMHQADEDSTVTDDVGFGNAVRLQPSMNFGKTNLRYLYYYVQPKFYSDAGSTMADKIQHQVSVDHRFNDYASVSASENYYWDHLPNSALIKRTYNDEKYLSLNLSPLVNRTSFVFRPYLNYLVRDSDDPINSAESTTFTVGTDLNDRLDDHTTCGMGYEYRAFIDEAVGSSSETFHRIRLDLTKDTKLFSRRLYFSISPSLDIRDQKANDDKDVSANANLSLQYDIAQRLTMRMGHTGIHANSAAPDADYVNNRGYLEFDFLLNKARAARFIVRGERNNYISENGEQSYREQRIITKFLINF